MRYMLGKTVWLEKQGLNVSRQQKGREKDILKKFLVVSVLLCCLDTHFKKLPVLGLIYLYILYEWLKTVWKN